MAIAGFEITATIDTFIREFIEQDEVKVHPGPREDHTFFVIAPDAEYARLWAMQHLGRRKPEIRSIAYREVHAIITLNYR